MKCKKCKNEMQGLDGNDDPNYGYAYNIHHCTYCMIICKEDVWENKGNLGIFKDRTIILEKENMEYTIYKEK